MEWTQTTIFWACTLSLDFVLLMKALLYCYSKGRVKSWSLQRCFMRVRDSISPRIGSHQEQEMDKMRCSSTRTLWAVVAGISMLRLSLSQVQLLLGFERSLPEFDLQLVFLAMMGLIINSKPGVVSPRTLDAWYVLASMLSMVSLLPMSKAYAHLFTQSFRAEILFAVLTKHVGSIFFCTVVHIVHAVVRSKVAPEQHEDHCWDASLPLSVNVGELLFFFMAILLLRKLLLHYCALQGDLKERTVELARVSSLLLVSFDAVVQIDDAFNMVDDSAHLSAMLLHKAKGDQAGKSFLNYFTPNDQDRVREQLASSVGIEEPPVMAMNADMLDADQNHLKVELVHAHFINLYEERRWLVGLRELQDKDDVAPLPSESPNTSPSVEGDLWCVFEVPSFEVLYMSRALREQCSKHRLRPENVLELCSDEDSAHFCSQLQYVANSNLHELEQKPANISFNLLGQHDVMASMVIESDELLETWVGTLKIRMTKGAATLSEANLLMLQSLEVRSGPRSRSRRRRSRRSRSSPLRL